LQGDIQPVAYPQTESLYKVDKVNHAKPVLSLMLHLAEHSVL